VGRTGARRCNCADVYETGLFIRFRHFDTQCVKPRTIPDKAGSGGIGNARRPDNAITSIPVKRNNPLTIPVSGLHQGERRESNPQPPDPQSDGTRPEPLETTSLAETSSSVCTPVCTTDAETVDMDASQPTEMGYHKKTTASQSFTQPNERHENDEAIKEPEIAVGLDLARVVEAWPPLPESMREAILKLIG